MVIKFPIAYIIPNHITKQHHRVINVPLHEPKLHLAVDQRMRAHQSVGGCHHNAPNFSGNRDSKAHPIGGQVYEEWYEGRDWVWGCLAWAWQFRAYWVGTLCAGRELYPWWIVVYPQGPTLYLPQIIYLGRIESIVIELVFRTQAEIKVDLHRWQNPTHQWKFYA